ncbi:hypothetical protein CDD83_10982 [Cordyceps sp. RAO-2017]|nr:hypothetical protein CDD83_10982 [Cordyceps sp. RAO-2017]
MDGSRRSAKAVSNRKKRDKTSTAGRKQYFKSPREYVAYLHKLEDESLLAEKSGKRTGSVTGSNRDNLKRQRTSHQAPEAAGALQRLQDEAASHDGGLDMANAPLMPAIQASLQEKQFALIKRNIPAGTDTRRTQSQEADVKEAVRMFGARKIKAADGKWQYTKMEHPLFSYQLTAVAWMVKRELDRVKPHGGVLADVMGLGKTVMSLACVTANPAEQEDIAESSKTTLVVVPNIIVAMNWKEETRRHCKDKIRDYVAIYNRKDDKPLGPRDKTLVLITTYSELVSQYPKDKDIKELAQTHRRSPAAYERAFMKKMGVLFGIKWYRVILDEAHSIKNIDSRTAKACCALESKHRWALSGTPLANSAEEFYPYLKFLQCDFTDSRLAFKKKYMPEGKANRQFNTLVSMVMYRRTLADTFMGHRMLELPDKDERDIWVPLSAEEKCIASEVLAYFDEELEKVRLARMAKSRSRGRGRSRSKNSENTDGQAEDLRNAETKARLSKIGRLREAVSHVFNIERMLRTSFKVENVQRLRTALGAITDRKCILDQLGSSVDGENFCLEGFETGVAQLRDLKAPVFGGKLEFGCILDILEDRAKVASMTCGYCGEKPPEKPVRLDPCGHFYCGGCFLEATQSNTDGDSGKKGVKGSCRQKDCGEPIEGHLTLRTLSNPKGQKRNFDEPGKDSKKVHLPRDPEENGFFKAYATDDKVSLPPSAKLTAAMAVVSTWLKGCPDDKIIVFVQFIMSAKVLGCMLESAGISFLYFAGAMPSTQRAAALEDFKKDPKAKVLVATMQSGGQSLNLTEANRVILVDPWWNTTVEKQAFCRVLRMGQRKKSYLVRIMAYADIDTRISELQQSKDKEINRILQDDDRVPDELDEGELEEIFKPGGKTAKGSRKAKKTNNTRDR